MGLGFWNKRMESAKDNNLSRLYRVVGDRPEEQYNENVCECGRT